MGGARNIMGLPYRTFAKFSDFLPPLIRKFTQLPLLRLLTMSAFEGTPPSPLSADVINGSPLIGSTFLAVVRKFVPQIPHTTHLSAVLCLSIIGDGECKDMSKF